MPHAVRISGAEGTHSASINGVYCAVEGEASGGRPVYKKDGADSWIEYWPARAEWQVKIGKNKGRDVAMMTSLGSAKEAGVVEEARGGWQVYDASAEVWKEQAGVRVVRHVPVRKKKRRDDEDEDWEEERRKKKRREED